MQPDQEGIKHLSTNEDTKRCGRCTETKPVTEFNRDRQTKTGYATYCRPCQRADWQAWSARKNDPARTVTCETCRMPFQTKHTTKRFCSKECWNRADNLWVSYGIKMADWYQMLEQQAGACAICKTVTEPKDLVTDHCHATNKVRGLLCNPCNMAIGLFRDNADVMRQAATYVEEAR
jgi:hypothetical protein